MVLVYKFIKVLTKTHKPKICYTCIFLLWSVLIKCLYLHSTLLPFVHLFGGTRKAKLSSDLPHGQSLFPYVILTFAGYLFISSLFGWTENTSKCRS